MLTRRQALLTLAGGTFAVIAGGSYAAVELVSHGVLPGKHVLDELDGACNVSAPPLGFGKAGRSVSGTFFSRYRRKRVGYTIAYPPQYNGGGSLPLVVCLHGYGGNHDTVFGDTPLSEVAALRENGKALRPMALVSVDGGTGYWTPHPGDDAMGMLVHELIPKCRQLRLGESPGAIGAMGISMGGYGAIILAEKYPHLISAVAAISPAVWTTYGEARSANPTAYASARAFVQYDAFTHTKTLKRTPIRVACGTNDPFYPAVQLLARTLPRHTQVSFSGGCHDESFFNSQAPASLAFLGKHLANA